MCEKLIARKVLCFSHSKVSKLDSINSWTVLINSWTASNVSKLNSSLDPRSFREARIENRVSSIKLRGTVNLPLSGTVSTVGVGPVKFFCCTESFFLSTSTTWSLANNFPKTFFAIAWLTFNGQVSGPCTGNIMFENWLESTGKSLLQGSSSSSTWSVSPPAGSGLSPPLDMGPSLDDFSDLPN